MILINNIKQSNNILIIGHQRPDGDCLGSGLALYHLCEKYKKNVDFLCDSDMPMHYDFMRDFDKVNIKKYSKYDLVIFVDCGDLKRAGRYCGYIKYKSINIDHHFTNDSYGQINIVDFKASSTCEIIAKILLKCNEIDDFIAESLFTGLSTDTGHFMHSNSNYTTFDLASQLLKFNVDSSNIATNLYKSNSLEKMKLIKYALNSMKFFHNNDICIISISQEDLKTTGCTMSDTEGLINYAMSIKIVKVAVCITEQEKTGYKVSFRSKAQDVSASASVFGGGGHKHAAGCIVMGKYEDVMTKIVKSITDGMED